jgi:Origin recognition complex winged helix C-terminal
MEKLSLLAKSIQSESLHGCDGSSSGSGNGEVNEGTELEKELRALQEKLNKNANPHAADEDAAEGGTGIFREEDEEEEATAAAITVNTAAANAPAKKRDRFFSKKSRKEALLFKAQATGTTSGKGSKNKGGASSSSQQQQQQPPSSLLAAWLYPWLNKALRHPPTQLPAAKFFTCRDASALDCLTAAPREAIHAALTRPQLYLPALGSTTNADVAGPSRPSTSAAASTQGDVSLGITADVEDACLAYQLFDQDPSCANVAEWFSAFKAVHDAKDDKDEGGDGGGDDGEEKGQKGTGKGKKNPSGSKGKKRKVAVDPTVAAAKAENDRILAARFSQATAELQFIGLIKPLKKRSRGDAVQRAVHMPAPLMGDV